MVLINDDDDDDASDDDEGEEGQYYDDGGDDDEGEDEERGIEEAALHMRFIFYVFRVWMRKEKTMMMVMMKVKLRYICVSYFVCFVCFISILPARFHRPERRILCLCCE